MVVCNKCGNEMKAWKLIGEFDYVEVDRSGIPRAGEGEGLESGIQGDEWAIFTVNGVWYYEDAYGYCFEEKDLVSLVRIVVQHMYDRQLRLSKDDEKLVVEMDEKKDTASWCNDFLKDMILDTWKRWKEYNPS